ncbi:MAG: hypothetical protein QM501_10895 [Gimesia sp.]
MSTYQIIHKEIKLWSFAGLIVLVSLSVTIQRNPLTDPNVSSTIQVNEIGFNKEMLARKNRQTLKSTFDLMQFRNHYLVNTPIPSAKIEPR